jgi:hypothetical protein
VDIVLFHSRAGMLAADRMAWTAEFSVPIQERRISRAKRLTEAAIVRDRCVGCRLCARLFEGKDEIRRLGRAISRDVMSEASGQSGAQLDDNDSTCRDDRNARGCCPGRQRLFKRGREMSHRRLGVASGAPVKGRRGSTHLRTTA